MRPFVQEYERIRALARAVGMNPHRWGIDPHVRKGVLVADLFVAAMLVVGWAISRLAAPFWFLIVFAVPVLAFAGALVIVVSAQSRDEARVRELRKK